MSPMMLLSISPPALPVLIWTLFGPSVCVWLLTGGITGESIRRVDQLRYRQAKSIGVDLPARGSELFFLVVTAEIT